jgi:Ca2+-binding RTX toxin-like protein
MKRAFLLLAFVLVASVVLVPIAYAAAFRCTDVPCIGTDQKDTIGERRGDGKRDVIRGKGRADKIKAYQFAKDADTLFGANGTDALRADDSDGRDYLDGGPGNDTCNGDLGDDFTNCENVNVNNNDGNSEADTNIVVNIGGEANAKP